jgi:MFS family permease
MTSNLANITKSKGFYGWIALSGAVFVLFSANAYLQSFGVFLPVVADTFGWNRATVAAALSLGLLAMGLPSPLYGILTSRFGPRINIILGNILCAACLAGLYFLHDLWYLYLLFIIGGLGAGIGGYIPITSIAVNWFTKKISLALALLLTAGGLASFIFPPLTTALITAVDWRLTWVILGGIILIGSTVIGGIILIRNKPEDIGQIPDGIKVDITGINPEMLTNTENDDDHKKWSMKKLLRLPVTWFIFVFTVSTGVVLGTMTSHQVAYMQDIGFSPLTAATTMSILAVGSMIASLAFGGLALRINIRYLGAFAGILQLAGMVILLTTRELTLLYVYSALVGMGTGALLAAMPTFVGTYFGRQLYSRVMGFINAAHIAASAVSGTFGGAIYDATGNYTLAFLIVVVFIVIGLVSVFLARKPRLTI